LNTHLKQIVFNVGFTTGLSQCIHPLSSKSLWDKVVKVKLIFLVSICMNSSSLCKYILTHYRLICRNSKTRKCLHQFAHRVQRFLLHRGPYIFHVIFEDRDSTRKWGMSRAFAHAIYSKVQTMSSCQSSLNHIGYTQVIIVVRMKVEMEFRVPFYQLRKIGPGF